MTILRGAAAGAVGTVALDAVTSTDMAMTGRPPSESPGRTVLAVADEIGVALDASGHRPEAYGALAGAGVGVAVGVLAGAARSAGVRLPLLAEAAVVGGAAMAATDGPMHWAGVADVATWSAADWARDIAPHLVYGLAVSSTLRAVERHEAGPSRDPRPVSRGGALARALAIGVATGARSSMGLVPPAARLSTPVALVGAGTLVATELAVDKLPATSSRLQPGPVAARVLLGVVGAVGVARRHDVPAGACAVAGGVGAAVGTLAGWVVREVAADRGIRWRSALAEDAVALGLGAWATR
jgi:hypothetical protein